LLFSKLYPCFKLLDGWPPHLDPQILNLNFVPPPFFSNNLFLCLLVGCIHNKTTQKGCQMSFKNNQDWRNIYVLSFKIMEIMASWSFFHSYECQGIQIKNPFDKILSLSFNLGPLKMNTYYVKLNQFCKEL